MKIKFLNKTIENQRFRYTPMYYDERKEKIKQKREQYAKLSNGSISHEERKNILRDKMKADWSRTEIRKNQHRSSNIRILILIALIVVLGYFVFNGIDEVDTIVNNLW